MTNEELFESIKSMIVDQLGVEEDKITMDSSFVISDVMSSSLSTLSFDFPNSLSLIPTFITAKLNLLLKNLKSHTS